MSELLLSQKPESKRFQSFIIFEPASVRVSPSDVFLQGEDVKIFYEDLIERVISQEQTLKVQILQNRLTKVGQMLELLTNYDNVIISKYFDRIWRRYAYISHLGENMLDLPTLLNYFPEYDAKDSVVVAQRFDDEPDDFDPEAEEDEEDDVEEDGNAEETKAAVE